MRPSVIFLALSVLDDTKMASRKVTTAAQLLPRPTPILTSKHLRLLRLRDDLPILAQFNSTCDFHRRQSMQ